MISKTEEKFFEVFVFFFCLNVKMPFYYYGGFVSGSPCFRHVMIAFPARKFQLRWKTFDKIMLCVLISAVNSTKTNKNLISGINAYL